MKNLKKIFAVAMSIATVAMSTSAFAIDGNSTATYKDGVASLTVDAEKDPTYVASKQMTVVIVPKDLGEIKDTDIQYINQDEATGFTTILAGMGTKDTINPADYEIRVGGTDITDVWVFDFEDVADIIFGDLDGDESVTIKDAIVAMKIDAGLMSSTDELIKAGDVDAGEDGITIKDAILMMKYDAGLITKFPCEE